MNVIISDTPHVRKRRTTKNIMLDVIIALIPAVIAGIVFFGYKAAVVLLISVASSVATEFVYSLCLKKKPADIFKNFDFTSVITGLLLGLSLSSTVPWYVPLLSAVFAVAVVKMLFGGTGKNIVNPAVCGRVFAFIAFQAVMISGWADAVFGPVEGSIKAGATVLTSVLSEGVSAMGLTNLDLFLGTGLQGCIGETCKLALLIGWIYLGIRKVIRWEYPLIILLCTAFTTVFLNKADFAYFLPSILSGGIFLGAVFMATDYVTSPSSRVAKYVYYACLGILVAVLRHATKIEVVSFVILLMNLTVPIFNRIFRPVIFGAPSIKEKLKARAAKKEAK